MRADYGLPLNIVDAATTVVKGGNGVLLGIVLNAATTGTVEVYDGTDALGTLIGTIPASVAAGTWFAYQCRFSTGLTIVTDNAADDITVTYL